MTPVTYIITPLLAAAILFVVVALARMLMAWRASHHRELALVESVERIRLEDQKERLLINLRDLDFEFRLGKLSKSDYSELRSEHEKEAMLIIYELDRLQEG